MLPSTAVILQRSTPGSKRVWENHHTSIIPYCVSKDLYMDGLFKNDIEKNLVSYEN
jgi:hypothetical protein